jgi:hypothetical protein
MRSSGKPTHEKRPSFRALSNSDRMRHLTGAILGTPRRLEYFGRVGRSRLDRAVVRSCEARLQAGQSYCATRLRCRCNVRGR